MSTQKTIATPASVAFTLEATTALNGNLKSCIELLQDVAAALVKHVDEIESTLKTSESTVATNTVLVVREFAGLASYRLVNLLQLHKTRISFSSPTELTTEYPKICGTQTYSLALECTDAITSIQDYASVSKDTLINGTILGSNQAAIIAAMESVLTANFEALKQLHNG